MAARRALITGITGQDGAYLAEFLLDKGYEVHGTKRRASSFNTQRIDHLYPDPHFQPTRLHIHYGDLSDAGNIMGLVGDIRPHEIYNLGAMSHVAVSFEQPEYTADVDGLGCLRLLEAIRHFDLVEHTRFYQASTSELFGKVREVPQKETTPFYPRSPYAIAKLFAYWTVVNYREAYGLHASNGILFNHESPLRGGTFVSRKVTRGLTRVHLGLDACVYLGNLDAMRDWGHARDYVRMQWMMLQQDAPGDYVIATGVQTSVREFVEKVGQRLGMDIQWSGIGVEETGIDRSTGKTVVQVDPRYFRPTEVEALLGDASKAQEMLGWVPQITIDDLVTEMVEHDLRMARREALVRHHGFDDADARG